MTHAMTGFRFQQEKKKTKKGNNISKLFCFAMASIDLKNYRTSNVPWKRLEIDVKDASPRLTVLSRAISRQTCRVLKIETNVVTRNPNWISSRISFSRARIVICICFLLLLLPTSHPLFTSISSSLWLVLWERIDETLKSWRSLKRNYQWLAGAAVLWSLHWMADGLGAKYSTERTSRDAVRHWFDSVATTFPSSHSN